MARPRYRPWTYGERQAVRDRGVKAFRNNAALRDEEEQRRPAASTPLDDYRGAATSARPLVASGKKKSSLWGKAKGLAGDVLGEVGEAVGDVGGPVLEILDKPAQYTLRPLLGAATYLGADRKPVLDAQGQPTGKFYRESPGLREIGRGFKEALTQNPLDSYWEGKKAFEERLRDPELTAGSRVLLGAVSDPLTYVGPGAVTKVARAGGLLTQGTRRAAVITKAAPWIESPRKAALGGALGAAAGAEAGERLGLGPKGQMGLSLAGGVVGASGLSMAAQRRLAPGMGGSIIDAQMPFAENYMEALGRHDIEFRIDGDGIVRVVDPERTRKIVKALEDENMAMPEKITGDWNPGGWRDVPEGGQSTNYRKREAAARRAYAQWTGGDLDPNGLRIQDDIERIKDVLDETMYPDTVTAEGARMPWGKNTRYAGTETLDAETRKALEAEYRRSPGSKAGREAAARLGSADAEEFVNGLIGPDYAPSGTVLRIFDKVRQSDIELGKKQPTQQVAAFRKRLEEIRDDISANAHAAAHNIGDAEQGIPTGPGIGRGVGAAPEAPGVAGRAAGDAVSGRDDALPGAAGGETVKRVDLEGNVTDTFQTEGELGGIKATQGAMDLEGKAGAWEKASAVPGREMELAAKQPETPPPGAGPESVPDEEPEFGFRDTPPEGPPPPLDKRDDWRTLGLDPNKTYTTEQVKQAYRAQARRYHPDVNQATTATEDMKAINAAFDRISGRSGAGPRTAGQQPGSEWWRAYREERARARSWRQEYEARRSEAQRQWNAGREERARARADLKAKERAFGAEPPRQEGGVPPGEPPKEPPMGVGRGGTEPFPEMGGAESRLDLLGTRTREETLSRAERRAQQPLAKASAKLRSALGRLKSDDVRQKVDPVLRAKNEVDNRLAHLPAWFMTRERAVMRESGLAVERAADGATHLIADGRDVGLFEDVVERVNDAGKAGYDSLSDIQKDAVAVIKETNDSFNQTLQFHGVEPRIDPDIEGDYFGRRVAGRTIETETGPQRIEKAEPANPTQRVGATRTKSRVMESVEELQRLGFDLEDPWVTRAAVLRAKLLDARDAYLKNNLGPLAVKEPGSTFGLGSVNQPAFSNMWFEADVAKAIEKGLAGPSTWAPKEALTAVNAVLTPLRASFDLSATLQQGMRMWLTNPKAAAEYWWTVMRSLKDPQIYERALLKMDADGPGIQKLLTWGLRFTGETVEGEFFFPQGAMTKLGKAGVVGKGVNAGLNVSNQHFGRTLNLYRVEFANSQYKRLVAAGLEGAELDEAMKSSTAGINRMFGWTGTKPTTVEQAALFAPRYFRASIETIEQAVKGVVTLGHASPEAAMARNHMALLLGEGAAAVVVLNTLRGYDTEPDPRSPNFLRLRNVGGLDVSPFGTYNTLFRAIAGAAAGGDYEDQPVKGRVGQLWRLVEGKMSPGMKLVYEPFVTGETYLGEPLDPLGDPLAVIKEQAKSSVPFGVQNLMEEGPLAAGVGSFGISSTPMTPAEKRDFARTDVAKEIFGRAYGDLKGGEKAQVNEQKKVAGHQAEVDRRALRTNTEFAKATQVRQQVEEELRASSEYLAAGRDDAGNPYSGNDFRKAYNDTMLRAAGMRSMLKEFGGDDEVGTWFDLYDKATMKNGQVNYDALERLQAEFRVKNPDIDEKVEKVVGIHDNAAVRELREAKKLARAYYQLPAYRGMNPADAEHAGEVLAIANDMVAFGAAKSQDAALRIIARTDPAGARLAKIAKQKGPNPARARFRKSQPLFAAFYSSMIAS